MDIKESIGKLIQYGNVDRDIYVVAFKRDSDGNVKSKRKYPIRAIFSHKDDEAEIYIEESECITDY